MPEVASPTHSALLHKATPPPSMMSPTALGKLFSLPALLGQHELPLGCHGGQHELPLGFIWPAKNTGMLNADLCTPPAQKRVNYGPF